MKSKSLDTFVANSRKLEHSNIYKCKESISRDARRTSRTLAFNVERLINV